MKKRVFVCLFLVIAFLCIAGCSHSPQNPFADLKRGDTVEFGTYNGNAIKWTVLGENRNGDLMLISTYILDKMPWTNEVTGDLVTWKDSYVRKTLNGSFYNNAFSAEEKEYILSKSNEMAGTKTSDRVSLPNSATLMSLDEYEAKTVSGKKSAYWLLDYSYGDRCVTIVDEDGNRFKGYHYSNLDTKVGVRPFLLVDNGN